MPINAIGGGLVGRTWQPWRGACHQGWALECQWLDSSRNIFGSCDCLLFACLLFCHFCVGWKTSWSNPEAGIPTQEADVAGGGRVGWFWEAGAGVCGGGVNEAGGGTRRRRGLPGCQGSGLSYPSLKKWQIHWTKNSWSDFFSPLDEGGVKEEPKGCGQGFLQ